MNGHPCPAESSTRTVLGPPSRVVTVAEMNRISRFFVNRFNARRSARIFGWMQHNPPFPVGAACLEIGCGNGDLASRVVEGLRPARYVATDLDSRQLDAARKHLAIRYPGGLPPSLEPREADMLHLPFVDGPFDAALALVSLHHGTPHHHQSDALPPALCEIDTRPPPA